MLSIQDIDKPVRDGFLGELAERRKDGISHGDAEKLRREYIHGRGRNNYYRVYETRDGLIVVACLQNQQRRGLRDALGIDDPTVDGLRYDWFSEEVRQAHRNATAKMEAAFRERSTAEWIEALDAADVPCGPVHFPEEMFEHPHVLAGDYMLDLEHDVVGALRMPRSPLRMSASEAAAPAPPPSIGEHSRDVLARYGYVETEIDALIEDGVVWTRERLLERDAEREGAG